MLLCGCAAGPDFHEPPPPGADRYTVDPLPPATVPAAAGGADAQRFVDGKDVPSDWWTTFDNAEISRRVQLALQHSPTIAAADAALRQAEEIARAARGTLLPSLDANLGVTRSRMSGARSAGGTAGGGAALAPYTVYNAGVSVSYAFDFSGGLRRGVEARQAQADVQRAQLDATWLALAANVVTASVQEASLREQASATRAIIAALAQQLDIAERQQAIGARSLTDTLAVRARLTATQATLPTLEKQLAATRNQLATYLGSTPAQSGLQAVTLAQVMLPADIPVTLPSKLAAQRPDIRAASAQLHSATALAGVATAAMLPQVTLNGSLGSEALSMSGLFGTGSGTWSLGLGLVQPLVHGGQLLHQRRAAEAAVDAAAANWQQTVLLAFQNVADALQALEYDAQLLGSQTIAGQDASTLLSLTQARFRTGAASYLDLLGAEQQYEQARIALIQARAARLADTAALYAALGGGWHGETTAAAGPGR